MKKIDKMPIDSIAGFACIFIFCIFVFTSMIFFTDSWSPLENTISQLGNSDLNPNGAIFFTIGMMLAGLFILIFYIGFYKRYATRFSDIKITMVLIIGLINAISIILTGIFSETVNYNLHVIFSIPIFITFIPILYVVGTFFIANSIFTKTISYYGFVVAIFTFMLLVGLLLSGYGGSTVPILESLSVFSYIGWIGTLSYMNRNKTT
jgi:hypothetical protein